MCSSLGGNFELLHQDLRVPSTLIVFFAADRGQIVPGAFDESTFGLEIREGLSRKRNEFGEADFTRFILYELNQLLANTLIFM